MNDDYEKTKSRRLTPWTGRSDSTPLESFIDRCTGRDYKLRDMSRQFQSNYPK